MFIYYYHPKNPSKIKKMKGKNEEQNISTIFMYAVDFYFFSGWHKYATTTYS